MSLRFIIDLLGWEKDVLNQRVHTESGVIGVDLTMDSTGSRIYLNQPTMSEEQSWAHEVCVHVQGDERTYLFKAAWVNRVRQLLVDSLRRAAIGTKTCHQMTLLVQWRIKWEPADECYRSSNSRTYQTSCWHVLSNRLTTISVRLMDLRRH